MVVARPEKALEQVRFTRAERDYVYAVAMKHVHDEEIAHEVTQEALLLAFRYRHAFRGDARFTTWLYRIAATSALMHQRRARRQPRTVSLPLDGEQSLPDLHDQQPSPEEISSLSETLTLCERLVTELGDNYASLFRLRYVEGFSSAESAQRLRLSVSTVRSRAHRACVYLRRRLAQESLAPAAVREAVAGGLRRAG